MGGRPPKFKSVPQLEKLIQAYFDSCFEDAFQRLVKKEFRRVKSEDLRAEHFEWIPIIGQDGKQLRRRIKPWTIGGLAVFLGTTRQTLLNYEQEYPKHKPFFDTIRAAKSEIQAYAEESLWEPKIASGVIFNLVNNYGWKTKSDEEIEKDKTNIQINNTTQILNADVSRGQIEGAFRELLREPKPAKDSV